MRFDNKVAVVTGGASGIGRATVELLAARGAAVAIFDVNESAGSEAATVVSSGGRETSSYKVNIRHRAEVESAVARVLETYGQIDILIVSAGIQRYGTATTTSDEQWAEVLDINLRGAWYAAQACLPHMKHRHGAIVNVASVQSLASQRNVFAYTISKHGMIGLTRSMAMDFAADNIRVNAVCPGTVDTPMLRWSSSLDPDPQSMIDACNRMHPLSRIAQPEEIAEVVAFLAHQSASFVTGAVWTVDGGLLTLIGGAPETGSSAGENP